MRLPSVAPGNTWCTPQSPARSTCASFDAAHPLVSWTQSHTHAPWYSKSVLTFCLMCCATVPLLLQLARCMRTHTGHTCTTALGACAHLLSTAGSRTTTGPPATVRQNRNHHARKSPWLSSSPPHRRRHTSSRCSSNCSRQLCCCTCCTCITCCRCFS